MGVGWVYAPAVGVTLEKESYTMTRTYDYEMAHKMDFMAIDYGFKYQTQIALVEGLADVLEYDAKHEPHKDPQDRVWDLVGESTAMMSHYDMAELWTQLNCYQPEIERPISIADQMLMAIEEHAHEFLFAVVGDTETPSQALYRINKLFPVEVLANA
jgi:hypothetical protein